MPNHLQWLVSIAVLTALTSAFFDISMHWQACTVGCTCLQDLAWLATALMQPNMSRGTNLYSPHHDC